MNAKKVFLTLVLLFILALILVAGLLFAETVAGVSLVLLLAGMMVLAFIPLHAQVSLILSTRQRE